MIWIIKKIFKWLLKIIVFLLVLVGIIYAIFNWPVKNDNQAMPLGITFSKIAAESLGLDWKKAYVEILDELQIERIRLVAYWTEIEKTPGVYDFSELDWQIGQAEERNMEIILAFGVKVPRWPECFVPEIYLQDTEKRETALLKYEKALIERYRNSKSIKIWQVENEPFLNFGNCSEDFVNGEIMDKEIKQTKELDPSRQILTTDSGELSLWYQAAKRGDIFGTTLYKTIYKKSSVYSGYFNYPIDANFFRTKRFLIEKTTKQQNFMVVELQAEPWGPEWVGAMSLDEQRKSMDKEKLKEMVVLAQKTGFSAGYLWGAEWWYWLKEKKGEEEIWLTAKELFENNVVEEKK